MRISIIGTGYVGLVTGVGLASKGHQVTCVDIDKEKVARINKGEPPIYEEGLPALLKTVLRKKLFSATTDLREAVLNSEITFLAVPTPTLKRAQDLSFIKKVSREIASALAAKNTYHTVVVKSTVAPGTSAKVVLPILKKGAKGKFGLCMNPEFLREGKALFDFLNPDRIVIGQLNKKSGDHLLRLYKSFSTDIVRTSLESAEMIKYANNAFLGTLISFSNEIANITEKIPGADVFEVLRGLYLDKRLNPVIGSKRVNPDILTYIYPGAGFGGSCLPKDINALVSFSVNNGYEPKLLSAVLDINEGRAAHLVNLLERKLGDLKGKRVAVLGLAFKPDTDDVRESPSTALIKKLAAKGARIFVYDPVVDPKKIKEPLFKSFKVEFCESLREALKDKDAGLLVTKWAEFKKITPGLLKREMKNPVFLDGRGFLQGRKFMKKVSYIGIGLGPK